MLQSLHVFVELLARVSARRQPVVQHRRVAAQHDDEVDPPLGEEVACVPVEDVAAAAGERGGF